MKIIIDYDSSWRNSFLDGSNNGPLPTKGNKVVGRNFVGSMTSLNKSTLDVDGNRVYKNFIKREVTIELLKQVI